MDVLNHILTPPGEGVFTVSSGAEYKKRLYEFMKTSDIKQSWQDTIERLDSNLPKILGIPSDTGGGILRGANWGPLFVRLGLYERHHQKWQDMGDVKVIPHLLLDEYLSEQIIQSCQQSLYQGLKLPVSPLSITEKAVNILYKINPKARLFAIGGDHSVSYPLTKSWLEHQPDLSKVGIVHFDAHTDMLHERMGVPINFGSWAYHVLKMLPLSKQFVQVGIRATTKPKSYWESNYGLTQLWADEAKDFDDDGFIRFINKALPSDVEQIYISFDIDAIDSKWVSATGTPEANGLDHEQVYQWLKALSRHYDISGCDLVEVAPFTCPPSFKKSDQTLIIAENISSILIKALMI